MSVESPTPTLAQRLKHGAGNLDIAAGMRGFEGAGEALALYANLMREAAQALGAPPQQEPVAVKRMDEVIAYLCGEGPLDGRTFGDDPPINSSGHRLHYWWRRPLSETWRVLRALPPGEPAADEAIWKEGYTAALAVEEFRQDDMEAAWLARSCAETSKRAKALPEWKRELVINQDAASRGEPAAQEQGRAQIERLTMQLEAARKHIDFVERTARALAAGESAPTSPRNECFQIGDAQLPDEVLSNHLAAPTSRENCLDLVDDDLEKVFDLLRGVRSRLLVLPPDPDAPTSEPSAENRPLAACEVGTLREQIEYPSEPAAVPEKYSGQNQLGYEMAMADKAKAAAVPDVPPRDERIAITDTASWVFGDVPREPEEPQP